jgi:hypothetical protein
MRFATVRWVILLALAASAARGQTAFTSEQVGNHCPEIDMDVDMKSFSALQPSRLGASPPPTQTRCYPDLSGLRVLGTYYSVVAGARLAYTQTSAYAQSSAARPAHAQAGTASCAQPCRPAYPYQQVPIDADGILAHCDSGLAGAAVSILHSLSINR